MNTVWSTLNKLISTLNYILFTVYIHVYHLSQLWRWIVLKLLRVYCTVYTVHKMTTVGTKPNGKKVRILYIPLFFTF